MVTPGRVIPPIPKQEPPETTMCGEELRQSERENAVESLQPFLKEGSYRRDCGVPNGKTYLLSLALV